MLHHLLGRFDVVQPFFQPALEFLAARNQTESRQGRPRLGLILRERRRAVAVQCGLQAVDKGIHCARSGNSYCSFTSSDASESKSSLPVS